MLTDDVSKIPVADRQQVMRLAQALYWQAAAKGDVSVAVQCLQILSDLVS